MIEYTDDSNLCHPLYSSAVRLLRILKEPKMGYVKIRQMTTSCGSTRFHYPDLLLPKLPMLGDSVGGSIMLPQYH
jgi:hypothetical protein